MKISYNWLMQYAGLPITPKEVAEMLTDCGLEVEGMEIFQSIKGGLDGIVIGEVLEKTKHPNADKLSITKISIGDGQTYQVVCGAPNVEAGQKVFVATIGATLYPVSGDPFEIKRSKIRGEISEGMICAEDEIGLGNSHSGIMVLPSNAKTGISAADYLNIQTDYIFEIGLTPNRSDAASHIGVARDLLAVWNAGRLLEKSVEFAPATLQIPLVDNLNEKVNCPVTVYVEDTLGCQRYSGIFVSGIVIGDSPLWLKDRLRSVGLKSINNIVDLTNFVMLETGQPLHAFDANKIEGNKIVVKKMSPNTPFVTLDGIERTLTGEELMICDEAKPLCIAGVYGGLNAGVTEETKNVFLESAWFNPVTIRKGSKLHGLKTDASFRFERGADPNNTVYALKRFVSLLKKITPSVSCSLILDSYPEPIENTRVSLNAIDVGRITGATISNQVIEVILKSLHIEIDKFDGSSWELSIPPFKSDVKRPIDVIEEILRIYGYNRVVVPHKLNTNLPQFIKPRLLAVQLKLSTYLQAHGLNEVMGNSLTKSGYAELDGLPGEAIKLLNPLSNDLLILRQSLLFSALEAVSYNKNRKNPDVCFFEFGKIYFKKSEHYEEENHLHIIFAGKRNKAHWMTQNENYSLYYLKSLVQNLLSLATSDNSQPVLFKEEQQDLFSTAISCSVKQKQVALLGLVKKKVLKPFDLDGEIFSLTLYLDVVLKVVDLKDRAILGVPRFPEVKRDLSIVLDKHISYESVEKTALETERKYLKGIQLFDVYQGEKMEVGKKSYAVSFILGDVEKTLEDKQIEMIMERLMKNLEQKLGAVIRRS